VRKPIDVDALWRLERIAAVSLSPDAATAVCAVSSYSMDENKGRTSLWLLPTGSTSPRRLTSAGDKDAAPAWSPQGDRIAFLAKREQGGRKDSEAQLYVIAAAGGEAERKSDFAPGIDDFKWMPDGRRIVFTSWVWPDAKGSRDQAKRHKAFSERKESAYITSDAHYRHWDRNLPMGRVPHLLMLDTESGRITDLFEGTGYELPRADTCAAHFDISPDGRRIAFVHDRTQDGEVWTMKPDGTGQRQLTRRRGDDFLPAWTGDGRAVAFDAVGTGWIMQLDADGSGLRRLVRGSGAAFRSSG